MKTLILPALYPGKNSGTSLLAQNLVDVLRSFQMESAVCTDADSEIRRCTLFPARAPKISLAKRLENRDGRSYEQKLYLAGALDEDYLKQDIQAIRTAIREFQPDAVLSLGREAGLIAARLENVPCWAAVHPGMLKRERIPVRYMAGLNQALSACGLEQALRILDLYSWSEKWLAFAPAGLENFGTREVFRCRGLVNIPNPKPDTNKICIFFKNPPARAGALNKILTDAFAGAPYEAMIWYEGSDAETIGNLHFSCDLRLSLLPGSIACIHDGSELLTQYCMALGIPQLVITAPDCIRTSNGLALRKYGCGLHLPADSLKMGTLYENYRALGADDAFDIRAQSLAAEYRAMPDLFRLASNLQERFH